MGNPESSGFTEEEMTRMVAENRFGLPEAQQDNQMQPQNLGNLREISARWNTVAPRDILREEEVDPNGFSNFQDNLLAALAERLGPVLKVFSGTYVTSEQRPVVSTDHIIKEIINITETETHRVFSSFSLDFSPDPPYVSETAVGEALRHCFYGLFNESCGDDNSMEEAYSSVIQNITRIVNVILMMRNTFSGNSRIMPEATYSPTLERIDEKDEEEEEEENNEDEAKTSKSSNIADGWIMTMVNSALKLNNVFLSFKTKLEQCCCFCGGQVSPNESPICYTPSKPLDEDEDKKCPNMRENTLQCCEVESTVKDPSKSLSSTDHNTKHLKKGDALGQIRLNAEVPSESPQHGASECAPQDKETPTVNTPSPDKSEQKRIMNMKIRNALVKSGLGVHPSSDSSEQGANKDYKVSTPVSQKPQNLHVREKSESQCGQPCVGDFSSKVSSENRQQGVTECPLKEQVRARSTSSCIIKEKPSSEKKQKAVVSVPSTSSDEMVPSCSTVDSYLPTVSSVTNQDQSTQDSPTSTVKSPVKLVKKILEKAAIKTFTHENGENMSKEDQAEFLEKLRVQSEYIASSIAPLIFDDNRVWPVDGVQQKIKSYFVLCYSITSFHELVAKFYSRKNTRSCASFEEIMAFASNLMYQLIQPPAGIQETKMCLYQRLYQEISEGKYQNLSMALCEVMCATMTSNKGRTHFMREVRQELDTFMESIRQWLQEQQELEPKKNPVRKTLRKLQTLVTIIMPPPPDMPEQMATNQEQRENHTSNEVDLPKTKAYSLYEWSYIDIGALVSEIVQHILPSTNSPVAEELYTELVIKLSFKISEWNVMVKPHPRHIDNVAKIVYRDLCKGYTKQDVTFLATVHKYYITTIIDTLQKHLEMPQRSSRFPSFLEPVRSAICRPFRRIRSTVSAVYNRLKCT